MSDDTDNKHDEQKPPQNSGDSFFDQMVRKQKQRQQSPYETYIPGEVRLYDPSNPHLVF